MLFAYTYRSSDGMRHTAEIEAPNRDAAFAILRTEYGIRPIKVVATTIGKEILVQSRKGNRGLIYILLAAFILLSIGGTAWWMMGNTGLRHNGDGVVAVSPGTGAVSPEAIARPRPRTQIKGFGEIDIEAVFERDSERFLTRYAMPGEKAGGEYARLPDGIAEDMIASLKSPILIKGNDAEPIRQLKGVVAGLKADILLLLSSGQNVNDVFLWLESRQKMEAAYRDRIVSGLKARTSAKGEVNHILRTLGLREVE